MLTEGGIEVASVDGRTLMLGGPRPATSGTAPKTRYALVAATELSSSGPAVNLFRRGYPPLYLVDHVSSLPPALTADSRVAYIAVKDRTYRLSGREWPSRPEPRSRARYSLFALARILLARPGPWKQSGGSADSDVTADGSLPSLSTLLGLGQPRVSQLLAALPEGTVEKTAKGWSVAEFDRLWAWHRSKYMGPAGLRLSWRGSGQSRNSHVELATTISNDAAREMLGKASDLRSLISGYEAVPLSSLSGANASLGGPLGPVVRYVSHASTRLLEHGYAPCTPELADVQFIVPEDDTIWTTAKVWGASHRTDPLITAWELKTGPGAWAVGSLMKGSKRIRIDEQQ